jgi:general secretion pathway protein G
MNIAENRNRMNARRGFTIIEVIVIVVILGIIAAVIAPRLLSRVGQSKQSVAAANGASLLTSLRLYAADCGSPEDGAGIDILFEKPSNVAEGKWKGPYVNSKDDLLDPWGNKYVLIVPGQHNVDFDVVSYGLDGQPGGEGENSDIIAGKKK